MTGPDTDLRSVQASLCGAEDAQIARVVAMVDAMALRGVADDLLTPLRPRLAQLRPARPFGFKRLLFTPLDPVIVPVSTWRSGAPAVPRTILAPLGRAVEAAMCGVEKEYHHPEGESVLASGLKVWPVAAVILTTLPLPPGWTEESGLPEAEYRPLRDIVAAILSDAAEVERAAQRRTAPDDDWIRHILRRVEPYGPAALATMVAILLARLPDTVQVLAVAGESPHAASDHAVAQTLVRLEAELLTAADPRELSKAAMDAARIATLLDSLAERADAERKRRIDRIRRDADTLCRRRFDAALADTLLHTGNCLAAAYDDAAITALESAARDLRRLEAAARRLGSADHFDNKLRQAAETMGAQHPGMNLADRARLIEILAGPEAAITLLT